MNVIDQEFDGYVGYQLKEELIKSLDAYGTLAFMVGFNDEWTEDPRCECAKPDVCEGATPICKVCFHPPHRGDWMACFDYKCYTDPQRVTHVAYHAVVSSDSGGFIDTLDQGVVSEDKAPFDLPNYWSVMGMENAPWTVDEIEAIFVCQQDWERGLRAAILESKMEARNGRA